MAKKCGLVIYYRSCRKKPRVYTVCDVARIASYAVQSGADPQDVISTVADRLGYSNILDGSHLSRKEIEESALIILKAAGTIQDLTQDIPVVSKLGLLISFIVQFAGTVSFVVGYVCSVILSSRSLRRLTFCNK